MPPIDGAGPGSLRKKLLREGLIAARFGLVGLAATATHILIVALLVSKTSLPVILANTFAFLSAFGISFFGNYLWTFQSPGEPRRALRRFLLISVSAFLANTAILALLLRIGSISPLYATIGSATVIPLTTYIASRLWGFHTKRSIRGRNEFWPNNPQ